jgi:phthalate 4,5-cis-dihydrodiol dehydrogenase
LSIGLGIVGLGPAGVVMLGAAFGHDQVSVVAVADTDIEWLGPGSGEPRRYRSLDRLLEDDRVEAVHIATPTPMHFDHVLQALSAGRHVIVEKPVTATAREAEELMRRAAAFGRVVIVGHSEAFEPYVQAARGVVASGAIGTPTMVIAEKFTDWMRRPRLPAEWDGASGGGLIRRQGVHQVDVVRTITGADFSVRDAKVRFDRERGAPGTYTAWLSRDDALSAVITHDGVGRLCPAPARPRAEDTDEASKRSRRRALLRRVLEERSEVRLGQADRERVLVLGTDGEVVASSRQVDVTTSAGTRALDLTAFAEGRHAVLDELVAAISGARGAVHDLAWGYESLRTCEDIERASRPAPPLSQRAGSASSR